jgi:hypothetical protein
MALADSVFQQFDNQREEVLRLLLNSPEQLALSLWNGNGLLNCDRGCMFRPGSPGAFSSLPRGVRKFHACQACRTLDKIVDLQKIQKSPPGVPFIIEAGSEVGRELMLSSEPATNLSIKITTGPPLLAQRTAKNNKQEVDTYLESDRFTHSTLMSWVLERILSSVKNPGYEKIYNAFICGDRGYLLSRALRPISELNSLPTLSSRLVSGVLSQLCVVLLTLDEHDFLHGNPSLSSLRFSAEPFSFVYQQKQISGPITLVMTDLSKSSITVKSSGRNLRLVARHEMPNRYAEALSLLPALTGNKYTLNQSLISSYSHLHTLGIRVCESMEAYCFILALMTSDTLFADVVLSDANLRSAFNLLWEADQVESVINDILLLRNEGLSDLSSLQLLNVLKPYTLRKDVLSILLESLTTQKSKVQSEDKAEIKEEIKE